MSHLMHTLASFCAQSRNRALSVAFGAIGLFSFTFLLTLSASAQPGTPYTSVESGTPLLWSATTTWSGGVVPPAGSNVTIPSNSYVSLTGDVEVGVVSISTGGTLVLGSHTFTVKDYMNVVGTLDAGTSTVVFDSNSAQNTSQPTVDGTEPGVTLYNVQIPSGAYVDFGEGDVTGETPDPNAAVTITSQLSLDGGAVVVNPPYYGSASTLKYNSSYTVSTEWTADSTNAAAKGVPHHVEVATGATLDFDAATKDYLCSGDFTVNGSGTLDMGTMNGNLTTASLSVTGASGAMDMSGMTGDVIVQGACTIGGVSGQSVTLTMPSSEGKGKLDVKGDLTLGASSNNALTISGDEGNIDCGGNMAVHTTSSEFGNLKFDGILAQTLSGQAISVDSLIIDNSLNDVVDDADVTFSENVDITPGGVFNPVQGSVQINGTFTMNSDATGTARIATLADAGATSDVTGDITFERYVPSVTDGYSFLLLGNYVDGALRSDWSSSFTPAFNMVMSFAEDFAVSADGGSTAWSVISTATDALEFGGKGYVVYTSANSSPTVTATGSYNTGQVDVPITYSSGANQGGGMNLISNPFPSPIDGSSFLNNTNNSGLFADYQIYDNATDTWKTSGTGAPSTIDVGQSFYVQTNGGGNAEFETSMITGAGSNSFVRSEDALEEGFICIRVEQEDGRHGETFLRFHEEGAEEWQWDLDVTFRPSGNSANPEIFSELGNGHKLLINSPGSLGEVEELALVVEAGAQGTVALSLNDEYALPEGLCGVIEDLETGETVGLGAGSLVVELESGTVYHDRFMVKLYDAPVFEATATHCEGGVVHLVGEETALWNVIWSESNGELDGTGCVTGLTPGEYTLEGTNTVSGCHISSQVAISEVCMGDFNLNGERDITDLLVLLVGIQPVDNFEGSFPETDCDCDGAMTTLDLLMFLPQFGSNCE